MQFHDRDLSRNIWILYAVTYDNCIMITGQVSKWSCISVQLTLISVTVTSLQTTDYLALYNTFSPLDRVELSLLWNYTVHQSWKWCRITLMVAKFKVNLNGAEFSGFFRGGGGFRGRGIICFWNTNRLILGSELYQSLHRWSRNFEPSI